FPQEDLIENLSFSEMVYLLLKGEIPSPNQARMLQSVLVSFCDHGVTPPSTQVARLMASTGSSMNACVSGGLLSFGKHHAGALERSMKVIQNALNRTDTLNHANMDEAVSDSVDRLKNAAEMVVDYYQEKGDKIPGFGHRFHQEDPRPPKLIDMAIKNDCFGIHTELVLKIQEILFKTKGIRMNIDGANAGILSDLGFEWEVGTGIFMIGRLPALVAHVNEEKSREEPFRKIFEIEEIYYDGPEPK
ncbi:MAG TPA: citryl-CoA lyase, partial [Methanobacteriaceae archaeon]|nr:citryl-CoA lyase [Methanobacteriaceae archaeon]